MLTIPEPCNEDFSKMTPTERGAFCAKCKIDTFDFRELSNTAVNKILFENQGEHLCGQFTNKQLESLNRDYLNWKKQKTKTFRSKFVLALILVFGLSLFSCNTEEEKRILQLQTLEMTRTPETQVRYVNYEYDPSELDLTEYVEKTITEPEVVLECVIPETIEHEPQEQPLVLDERIYQTAGIPVILGSRVSSFSYTEYLYEVVDTTEETTLPEIVTVDPDYFEAKAYPNPTRFDATLALDIHKEAQFDILMFDMSGRMVQTIYSGILDEGRQSFPIELTERESGLYIIKVVSGEQNETVKVQKVNS